ncbi:glucose-6-phosphate isomerase [Arthrobacter sp. H35-D1]|uniref:glucose-6-phosphate isomerase n=1 Tax=Arthrobacter sp. H35-D1 TaxID=3046202 RepID=UPI0024B9CBFF|nr:glucose-6-phosphate isomerase [Arthrobacter sp. H35-D1]MDJ0313574.1 glucose-6-phosphate isomerase [Arthrobacter sp. H35-D1]
MSTPAPDNGTHGSPAASRAEPRSRKDLPAWRKLEEHADRMGETTLRVLFDSDPERASAFAVEDLGMYADFAKNRINAETLALLAELAEQCGLKEKIDAMFSGEKINVSEDRAVLHTALRASRQTTIELDGHDVVPEVHEVLEKMAGFATAVRSGQWKGHTGQRIRNVINIGIGGSDLGPRMAYQALHPFTDRDLRLEFVSNIDGAEFAETTHGLDPAETLFIVSSKSWRTLETLTNAATAREWTLAAFDGDASAVARHFVAVSTNTEGVTEFGIDSANMFGFWDWVGGRYSVDSAVGLSLMVGIGPENFTEMLGGFHDVDEHFRTTPLERNIPALMGLISVWYNNFMGAQSQAVLPYSNYLSHLPAYLQQLEMESNGKHVTLDGAQVDYQTGQIIWGQPGTNGQHAFYQLLHQGTKLIPCDFIAVVEPFSHLEHQHDLLNASVFAQTEGLAFGRSEQELRDAGSPEEQIPHRVCKGNQPTTTLLLDRLDPRSLGTLIALYEHKVFTEGVVWDVDSFDQWGVELGKLLADTIAGELTAEHVASMDHDGSTTELIRRYRTGRGRG